MFKVYKGINPLVKIIFLKECGIGMGGTVNPYTVYFTI